MRTPPAGIAMFALAAFLGAVGQMLYKAGADRAGGSLMSYLLNLRLGGGVLCYIAVMGLFVAAFKGGGALTVLYPIYATTFVWAALLAWLVYGAPIRPINVVGMLVLIVGMYLMGR